LHWTFCWQPCRTATVSVTRCRQVYGFCCNRKDIWVRAGQLRQTAH
jgi:hypothetical protein